MIGKSETELMLDLETMSTASNAAIIAIGAVAFTGPQVTDTFYTLVNLESAIEAKADVSASTVIWWLKQSEQARAEFFKQDTAPSLKVALEEFASFCKSYKPTKVWGNGASFDNVILSNAYKSQGMAVPWPYYADSCFRTIRALYEPLGYFEPSVTKMIAHHALHDARWQAEYLIALRQRGVLC